jgi:flagellar biosynthesis/type III secretory pathway protein FliH
MTKSFPISLILMLLCQTSHLWAMEWDGDKPPKRYLPNIINPVSPKKTKYASPILDTAFKQALSVEGEHGADVIISFLNTFVPDFREDPVTEAVSQSLSHPILPERGKKQTFLDFHIVTQSGAHATIEMQTKRHPRFDERALFYLTSVHSNQLNDLKKIKPREKDTKKEPAEGKQTYQQSPDLTSEASEAKVKTTRKRRNSRYYLESDWYYDIKKTYAIQILNYDTEKASGIETVSGVDKKFIQRVTQYPLPEDCYMKHYIMTDRNSGQFLDEIQMIQIELPRFKKALFPSEEIQDNPNNLKAFYENFTIEQWWISVFRYAGEYGDGLIDALDEAGVIIPGSIQKLFGRLEYGRWNANIKDLYNTEYKDITDTADMIAWEKAESKQEGIEQGKKEGIEQGKKEGIEQGKKEQQYEMALEMLKEYQEKEKKYQGEEQKKYREKYKNKIANRAKLTLEEIESIIESDSMTD